MGYPANNQDKSNCMYFLGLQRQELLILYSGVLSATWACNPIIIYLLPVVGEMQLCMLHAPDVDDSKHKS